MQKREVVAMVLAGGQGSRLGVLTNKLAKPAIPFGGQYRLIDFVLSNCANSKINQVGVLTQYKPQALHTYIGDGSPWGLDINFLSSKTKEDGDGYKGTANAVYQNLDFISTYDPKYVLILSGDHIYKMDYGKLLAFHKQKRTSVTISVTSVPWEDASRFGVMITDKTGKILEFQEKPEVAKSNLASMGVYVFNFDVLKTYLTLDEENPSSTNDFGKDVIPSLLETGEAMYAHSFQGYWKDVGTIKSLWQANMDLLKKELELTLKEQKWKVFTVNQSLAPHLVGPEADVQNSLLSDGSIVLGKVHNSVISTGTYIAPGAEVFDSVLMPGAKIEEDSKIYRAIIGENTVIREGAQVGILLSKEEKDELNGEIEIAVVEDHVTVPEGKRIVPSRAKESKLIEDRIS